MLALELAMLAKAHGLKVARVDVKAVKRASRTRASATQA